MTLDELKEIILSKRYAIRVVARALGYKNLRREEYILEFLPFVSRERQEHWRYKDLLEKIKGATIMDIEGQKMEKATLSESYKESQRDLKVVSRMKSEYGGKMSLSSSGFERALACNGSNYLKAKGGYYSGKQSSIAQFGEAVHQVLETLFCTTSVRELKRLMRVSNSKELATYIENLFRPLRDKFDSDREALKDIQANFIKFITQFKGLSGQIKKLSIEAEKKFQLERDEIKLTGRADLIIMNSTKKIAHVIDFKTGAVPVSGFDNKQLYFLGNLAVLSGFVPATYSVRGIIVNLRAPFPLYSSAFIDTDAKKFDQKLSEMWRKGDNDYETGSQCRYCPVMLNCPEVLDIVNEVTNLVKKEAI